MDSKLVSRKIQLRLNVFWRRWLRHLILIFCFINYALIGALIFKNIEEGFEVDFMNDVWDKRDDVLHYLWEMAQEPNMSFEIWRGELIMNFQDHINEFCVSQAWVDGDKYQPVWTFMNCLRYCCSIFFSIGYGDMYPNTDLGRFVTIMYAVLGIPFNVYCINFYGAIFREITYRTYSMFLFFYYTGKIKKMRVIHPPPIRAANKIWWSIHALTISHGSRPPKYSIALAEKKWAKREISEFEMPLLLALSLAIVYIYIMGHMIYTYLETWNAVESFYYLFIVLLTIGFGDYIIHETIYMLYVHIMMFSGFVIITMLLDIIQLKTSRLMKAKE